jgi:hypothetical protein
MMRNIQVIRIFQSNTSFIVKITYIKATCFGLLEPSSSLYRSTDQSFVLLGSHDGTNEPKHVVYI